MERSINSYEAYRGRLAPTPSGFLHKGHAFTFGIATFRARVLGAGKLYLRMEDLDSQRCKKQYVDAAVEDLKWLGLEWDDAYEWDQGICFQSKKLESYRRVLKKWIEQGSVYPCSVSRKQLRECSDTRQSPTGELIFPESLRNASRSINFEDDLWLQTNWRWRVDSPRKLTYFDQRTGEKNYIAGEDFGDFLVWSKAGYPSYEMAVVVDDIEQKITEVVRGEDLVVSTARQMLLYEALQATLPKWYHCPLVTDENGVRLAKSYDSLSIRAYREKGYQPKDFWRELSNFGMKEAADWLSSKQN